jgi:hypothetical protein
MVQQLLAGNEIDIEASRALILKTCWELDTGAPAGYITSITKTFVAEAVDRVADRALRICGALGVSGDAPIPALPRSTPLPDLRRALGSPPMVHRPPRLAWPANTGAVHGDHLGPSPTRSRPFGPALITGASCGIGLEIASRLAAEGSTLTLSAHRESGLLRAATELHGASAAAPTR